MRLYDQLKLFIKNHSNQSTEFVGAKTVKQSNHVLSIQSKHYLQASELTSDQETIDKIVETIIKKDKTHRYYTGKKDNNINEASHEIYKYESFSTHNVTIVPNDEGLFDLYVEGFRLGHVPERFTVDIRHYLQTTILIAFAYVKGGPYKYYDPDTQRVIEKNEPFDLSTYIQFS